MPKKSTAEEVDKKGPHHENGRVTYAPGTQQNQDVLIQAGLYGMSLPRQYGGLNFSMVPYVMAAELVARADAGPDLQTSGDCRIAQKQFTNMQAKK